MNKLLKTDAMKRLSKRTKSKRGTTLVELIAVVAILAIVASLSLEAMYMATEEYRRVRAVSESERSISLMQENIDLYAKNAVGIDLVENTTSPDVQNAINEYIVNRASTDPLQDAENQPDDDYIDIFLYRSGEFTYTLAKYKTSGLEKITTVSNIKEINLNIKSLSSSYSDMANATYLLDYAVISPTGVEMIYSVSETVNSSSYSNEEGLYSVISGTVLNNIDNSSSVTTDTPLRMCEKLSTGTDTYNGTCNFVVIRTVPREAK